MVLDLGTVISVKDGVVRASGLQKVASGETVKIGNIYGMALNLEANIVSIVIFGNDSTVREGDSVERTKSLMSVPVGDAVLGRVVNALGGSIREKGPINTTETLRVERKALKLAQGTPEFKNKKLIIRQVSILGGLNQLIVNKKEYVLDMLGRTPQAFRQSRLAQKLYEDSVLRITRAVMPTKQELADMKNMSTEDIDKSMASKYVDALFVKKDGKIEPAVELITGMDIIKTLHPKKSFIKKPLYDTLYDFGISTVTVDRLDNKVDLTFISNMFMFHRIQHPNIVKKFLIDDKEVILDPRFRGHTRQPHNDGEVAYAKSNHGTDAKLGGPKLDGRSNINYAYLDDQNSQFGGICNSPMPYSVYLQTRLDSYVFCKSKTTDAEARFLLEDIIQTIERKNLPYADIFNKIQETDINLHMLINEKGAGKLGFYVVPSYLITQKIPFLEDGEPRILHQYPNVMNSYPQRGLAYSEIFKTDKELTEIIKSAEGSPWEIATIISENLKHALYYIYHTNN